MTLESSKTLAGIGSILMFIPIVGFILLLMGMKGVSEHYKDESIYQNTLMGGIFCVIAVICSYAALFCAPLIWGGLAGVVFYAIAVLVGAVLTFVFMLLAVFRLKKAFIALADHSGENLFRTAASLLWIGAILTIILVGILLVFVAFILAGVAFLTLKTTQNAPAYGYTPPPTQAPPNASTTSNVKSNFCPNCGTPVAPEATFCSTCGKQI